ncbi:hypothetical protein [Cupriavidus necator]|uniref:hypothetical protein n=1 Tax=Cupriavidus necator TaxID=106590 RepID=UPI00339D37A2
MTEVLNDARREWVAACMASIAVIVENPALQPVIVPLATMLTEALLESNSLAACADPQARA